MESVIYIIQTKSYVPLTAKKRMNTKSGRTLVSFDWAAKKILRDKANFDIWEGFLTTLLEQEIKIISLNII